MSCAAQDIYNSEAPQMAGLRIGNMVDLFSVSR
jgi:hypothetical protein